MTIFKWEIGCIYCVLSPSPINSPQFYIEPTRTFQFCLRLYALRRNPLEEIILMLWRCDSNESSIELQYELQFDETVYPNNRRVGTFTYTFENPMQYPSSRVYISKLVSQCEPQLKVTCKIREKKSSILEDIDEEVMRDLSSNYESLLNNGTLSDLQFNMGNTNFYFHNAILEARCSELAEKLPTLRDVDATILQSVAKFLYSGKFTTWTTKIIPDLMELFGNSLHKSIYPFKIIAEYYAKTSVEGNCYIFDWVIDNFEDARSDKFIYVVVEEDAKIQLEFCPFPENPLNNFKLVSEYKGFIKCKVGIQARGRFISLVEMYNNESNLSSLVHNNLFSINRAIDDHPNCVTNGSIMLNIYIYLCNFDLKYTSKVDQIRYTNIHKEYMYMYNLREDYKKLFHQSQYYDFTIIVNYEFCIEDHERFRINYIQFNSDHSTLDADIASYQTECIKSNANNVKFHVHKVILLARSPVFRAMFSHDNIENQTNEREINNIKPYVLNAMLLFMYCGQLSSLNMNLAFDLYSAADFYDIPMLRKKCSDFLKKLIGKDTVAVIQYHANRYNIERLIRACEQYRRNNMI